MSKLLLMLTYSRVFCHEIISKGEFQQFLKDFVRESGFSCILRVGSVLKTFCIAKASTIQVAIENANEAD